MKNMGSVDRIVRLILAAIFAYLYFGDIVTGTLAFILFIVAIIFAVTAFVSTCPLYMPFKISTREKA